MSKKVHCRSLSSIHIHYNHDPVQALCSLPGRCTQLAIFNWPEVVLFYGGTCNALRRLVFRLCLVVCARSRAASGPACHPRGVLCPSGMRPGLLRAVVKTPIRSDLHRSWARFFVPRAATTPRVEFSRCRSLIRQARDVLLFGRARRRDSVPEPRHRVFALAKS